MLGLKSLEPLGPFPDSQRGVRYMLSSASVQDIIARFEATGRREGFIGFESTSSMDESEPVAEKCLASHSFQYLQQTACDELR